MSWRALESAFCRRRGAIFERKKNVDRYFENSFPCHSTIGRLLPVSLLFIRFRTSRFRRCTRRADISDVVKTSCGRGLEHCRVHGPKRISRLIRYRALWGGGKNANFQQTARRFRVDVLYVIAITQWTKPAEFRAYDTQKNIYDWPCNYSEPTASAVVRTIYSIRGLYEFV